MPAQLVSLTDGPNILLDKPIMLFGRHPECDVQIDSRKISRRHCCVAQVGDYLVVRDLGSTNGIKINGRRVLEGRMKDGDELTIGNHRFRVQWGAAPRAAGRPKPSGGAEVQPKPAGHAAQGQPPSYQGPVPPIDDALLEDCDEPLAIPEDCAPPGPVPAAAPAAKGPAPQTPAANSPNDDSVHLLPEELRLAPGSEEIELPRPPGQ
ncbi:MAG: FHA domain-containing protein [Gemmataceae bacterium]|nr:FHA domain-containing protein [Gemmataceae bacterium]MDW8264367.1 FHA domain-containing protein [Gemmataceae bacterium]